MTMSRFGVGTSALALAAMLTSTTTATTTILGTASDGLPWCENIDTFYRSHYVDGKKQGSSQCLPSETVGAYYTTTGEKDEGGQSDRQWFCIGKGTSNQITDDAAHEFPQRFSGACHFNAFASTKTKADVEDCKEHLSHNPAVCSPGPKAFWGACWSNESESWQCIPNGDVNIPGLAKGDCKGRVLLKPDGEPSESFYDGFCRFSVKEEEVYKCDTVPSYSSENAGTCGGGGTHQGSACFRLKEANGWQCFNQDEQPANGCEWTPTGAAGELYKFCVFPGNSRYLFAKDAKLLSEATQQEASKARNLKWRWAEDLVFGVLVPTMGSRKWHEPESRAALKKELEAKVTDPEADAKQYKTRKVRVADAKYPKQKRTFEDYTKLLEWLQLDTDIQGEDEL